MKNVGKLLENAGKYKQNRGKCCKCKENLQDRAWEIEGL
jgi:hypothetical protein